MEHADELERDAEDGWVETMNPTGAGGVEKKVLAFDDDEEQKASQVVTGEKKQEKVIDLESSDDDENLFAEKPAAKKQAEPVQQKLSGVTKKSRKYDLSITYDFYT